MPFEEDNIDARIGKHPRLDPCPQLPVVIVHG